MITGQTYSVSLDRLAQLCMCLLPKAIQQFVCDGDG